MISTATKTDWKSNTNTVIRDFQRDGYVALRAFLSDTEITKANENIQRVIQDIVPSMPDNHVFYEEKNTPNTLKQIQQLHTYDPYFQGWAEGRFCTLASTLLKGKAVIQNVQYFNKPPIIGKPTPPHQDGFFFKIKPVEAITIWLALEPVDTETGCVRYVRGSHKYGMRYHARSGVLGFSQHILDFGVENDMLNETAFPASPGDLLAHHALTVHWADGNASKNRTRKALGFIYYRSDVEQDKDAYEAYQRQLAAELKAEKKI